MFYKKNVLLLIAAAFLLFVNCSKSNILKGNACLSLGDYVMAEYFFEKALTSDPLSFDARLGMGKALLQHVIDNKNDTILWKKALLNLESAMNLHPHADLNSLVSDAWYERSQLLLGHNDTLGAFNALSRAIEINNLNITAINSIGILYFHQGDIDKSIILFKQAISADSTNSPALFNLGMALWSRNDYKSAHQYWLEASKLSPDDNDMVYWLAMAEKKLQESVQ